MRGLITNHQIGCDSNRDYDAGAERQERKAGFNWGMIEHLLGE